jgi:hypothetical protein
MAITATATIATAIIMFLFLSGPANMSIMALTLFVKRSPVLGTLASKLLLPFAAFCLATN